jgi:DnaJ family protein A protein 2
LDWTGLATHHYYIYAVVVVVVVVVIIILLQWKLKHLDGREVVIKTRPGQVIECEAIDPDSRKAMPYMLKVENEGMPSRGNPFVKGDLYVTFHIKFPTRIDPHVAAQIKSLLPDAVMDEDYDAQKVEEHFLEAADLRHFGKGGATEQVSEYDSDGEEGQGAPVQCQQS